MFKSNPMDQQTWSLINRIVGLMERQIEAHKTALAHAVSMAQPGEPPSVTMERAKAFSDFIVHEKDIALLDELTAKVNQL
jgi:hypothetical protein